MPEIPQIHPPNPKIPAEPMDRGGIRNGTRRPRSRGEVGKDSREKGWECSPGDGKRILGDLGDPFSAPGGTEGGAQVDTPGAAGIPGNSCGREAAQPRMGWEWGVTLGSPHPSPLLSPPG